MIKFNGLRKFWQKLNWFICEIIKTFSHEGSVFSSKKIERMMFVVSALIYSHYWFWTHVDNLTYEQIIAFVSMHLGFAGYSLVQTQKEKRLKNQNESNESVQP